MTAEPVAVRLLGGFALSQGVRWLRVPGPSARVVALLALRGRLGREHVAALLWPDAAPRRADSYLRTALWRLNAVAGGLVTTSGRQLDLACAHVDACALLDWAAAVLEEREVTRPEPTADDVGRELLPDWEDDWVDQHRERLRVLVPEALEAQARAQLRAGRAARALASALAAHQLDPLRESSVRIQVECHLRQGNRMAAVRAVDAYRALLLAELGVEPGPELARLLRPRPAAKPFPGTGPGQTTRMF